MIDEATLTLIAKAVRGDMDAVRFFALVLEITEAWDGLVDKDEPVSDKQINGAFTASLITLQNNAFYRRHVDKLQPLMLNSIVNWRIATAVERDTSAVEDLRWAFVVRSSYVDILLMCACCVEGIEWAVEVGPEVRRYVHKEGFDNYLAALGKERAARGESNGLLQ